MSVQQRPPPPTPPGGLLTRAQTPNSSTISRLTTPNTIMNANAMLSGRSQSVPNLGEEDYDLVKNVLKNDAVYKTIFPKKVNSQNIGVPYTLYLDEKVSLDEYLNQILTNFEAPTTEQDIHNHNLHRRTLRSKQTRLRKAMQTQFEHITPNLQILYSAMEVMYTTIILEILHTLVLRQNLDEKTISQDEDLRFSRYKEITAVMFQVNHHLTSSKLPRVVLYNNTALQLIDCADQAILHTIQTTEKNMNIKINTTWQQDLKAVETAHSLQTAHTRMTVVAPPTSQLYPMGATPTPIAITQPPQTQQLTGQTTGNINAQLPLVDGMQTLTIEPNVQQNNSSLPAATSSGILPQVQPHMQTVIIQDPRDTHLPVFRGNYQDWNYFFGQFIALVGNNQQIPIVMKMKRLMDALKGPPLRDVQHLSLSEANYPKVVEILRNNYGRPEAICSAMMAKITAFYNVKSPNTTDFGILVDHIQQLKVHLEIYQPATLAAPLTLMQYILPKLPRTTVAKWTTEKTKLVALFGAQDLEQRLFEEFVKFLLQEKEFNTQINLSMQTQAKEGRSYYSQPYRSAFNIQQAQIKQDTSFFLNSKGHNSNRGPQNRTFQPRSNRFQKNKSSRPFTPFQGKMSPNNNNSARQARFKINNKNNKRPGAPNFNPRTKITSPFQNVNKSETNPCTICNSKDHKPTACSKTMGPKELMDFVVKQKLCLNCFRKGHVTAKCLTPSQCGINNCQFKHHKRLHGLPKLTKRK